MDATQVMNDSILESEDEEDEEEKLNNKRPPVAKLRVLKNPHIPETEFPLFVGNNVLGRDPSTCNLLFAAPSVSKEHATICVSVYHRRMKVEMETLVWDLGSMNGTRKGRLKLTPNVRYALSEGDNLVVADIVCQYVRCDSVKTPVSINLGTKTQLPDGSGDKIDDTSTGGQKYVNSCTKTPVRGSCPSQPQGTLVPESDSDSESEPRRGREKKLETLGCDSESSPLSASFLSPTNKTVPESDTESPITSSSSFRNGSHRNVSFNTDESNLDVRQKTTSPVTVGKSEGQADGEDEKVLSKDSEQHLKHRNSRDLREKAKPLVSTPELSRKNIPSFNVDSDTDMENGEHKAVSAGPSNAASFHMDSDTDVDEDEDEPEVLKSISSCNDTKPSRVVRPDRLTMNSDTDEDVPTLPNAATASVQDARAGNFHLDSDTDVDEEAEGIVNKDSEKEKAANKPDRKLESATATPHILYLESDTDDEVTPDITQPAKSAPAANAGPESDISSDSGTDVDSPPAAVPNLSLPPGATSKALKSDSEADTDVEESGRANPGDFRMDSDTDIEDQELDDGKAEKEKTPELHRETPAGLMVPLENCSTELRADEMETQVFASPSSIVFSRTAPSAVGAAASSSSSSDSQVDEDFVVAETQSYVLLSQCPTDAARGADQTNKQRGQNNSFQLGLTDSVHTQQDDGVLAMENTQAFVATGEDVNLKEPQMFANAPADDDVNLESTQADGEDGELVRRSETSKKDNYDDFALEETQAYGLELNGNSESDSEENQEQNTDMIETQFVGSLATAETLPVTFESESLETESSACSAQEKETHFLLSGSQSISETQPMCVSSAEESGDENSFPALETPREKRAAFASETPFNMEPTQPAALSDDGESDEESITAPRKRKAKRLDFEEEQTQELANSEVSSRRDEDSEVMPGPPKRKAKALQIEDESQSEVLAVDGENADLISRVRETKRTQEITNAAASQTLSSSTNRGSDASTRPRKRKAEPPQSESETFTSSGIPAAEARRVDPEVQTQLSSINEENNDGVPVPSKRKAKESHEQAKPEVSAILHEDANLKPSLRKRKPNTAQAEDESTPATEIPERAVASRRQTRGKLSKRGKVQSDDGEDEETKSEGQKPKAEKAEEKKNDPETVKRGRKTQSRKVKEMEANEKVEEERKEEEKLVTKAKQEEGDVKPARGRRTIATASDRVAKPTDGDFPASRTRSRSNSSNSITSERSNLEVSAQDDKGKRRARRAKEQTAVRRSRRKTTAAPGDPQRENDAGAETSGLRGGRLRGGARKSDACSNNVVPTKTEQTRPTRGRNTKKPEEASSERDAKQAGVSRGQQQARSEDGASNDVKQSDQDDENLPEAKENVTTKDQNTGRTETSEDTLTAGVVGDKVKSKRNGRKSQATASEETNSVEVSKEKVKEKEEAGSGKNNEANQKSSEASQVRKSSRTSSVQTKKTTKQSPPGEELEDGEKTECQAAEKKTRGRTSVHKNKKADVEGEISTTPTNQDVDVEAPKTPTSIVSRKRQAASDSSPLTKTLRSSSGSPLASGRMRVGGHAYKVLFTGVVDEAGERMLARLGGGIAKGVTDMNCLVTDKVRRTVKFLCAVAKGIPVVGTEWLRKSGEAGSFLSPSSFIVKDPEQEKKFNFNLQESLRTASIQPLLQGYEIHVTKSVNPVPAHMKDIISSSGAIFLPKMPSSHKAQTIVISCEDDWRLCGPAVSASLPVVTAEFILTGILQQKVDFKTHALCPPKVDPSPARGRRKV